MHRDKPNLRAAEGNADAISSPANRIFCAAFQRALLIDGHCQIS
jgi:hypothetical protein